MTVTRCPDCGGPKDRRAAQCTRCVTPARTARGRAAQSAAHRQRVAAATDLRTARPEVTLTQIDRWLGYTLGTTSNLLKGGNPDGA